MLYHKNHHVTVSAPARLHLGFVDLAGTIGRKFISLGVAINGFNTQLSVTASNKFSAEGPSSERALDYARALYEKWNLDGGCRVVVDQAVPRHAGLGSGTQLALSVGTAIALLWERDCSPAELADLLGRGARSGIGIATFSQGGMIVDGGRGKQSRIPPTIARHAFPEAWRVLLILDQSDTGLHGATESNAFSSLPDFTNQCAGYLSHQVLARVLPGLIEQDVYEFGLGVREVQQRIGDYFAPAQGGRYTSGAVAEVIEYLIAKEIPGVGQSSWGPTGFAFFDSETAAHSMLRELQTHFSHMSQLQYKVVTANNVGAQIELVENSPVNLNDQISEQTN